MTQTIIDKLKRADGPEKSWAITALENAFASLRKAADKLSFAAQISGGTAGRDEGLCAAIEHYDAERDKASQIVRIVHFEWNDPEVGAGYGSLDQCIAALRARSQGGE